jgi:hypothetical protein
MSSAASGRAYGSGWINSAATGPASNATLNNHSQLNLFETTLLFEKKLLCETNLLFEKNLLGETTILGKMTSLGKISELLRFVVYINAPDPSKKRGRVKPCPIALVQFAELEAVLI